MATATKTKSKHISGPRKAVALLPSLQARQGKTFKNYIHGEWVAAASGKTFANLNPADTDDVIGHWPDSGTEDTRRAIAMAQKAFHSWQQVPAPRRGRIVHQAAAILRQKEEELGQALTWEEGKWLREARTEVQRGLGAMEFLAEEGRRLAGETIPSENPNVFAYTVRRPLGVVGVITPWNFPFAIPAWKIAPALVAGNTVVFKAAKLTPLTAQMLVEAYHEAGLPPGVLNMVHGGGGVVGNEIVNSPLVRAITFTGSTEVGKQIHERASKHLTRVQLEMGGKNAAIVLADCDLDWTVKTIVEGAFGSTGQRCTATSRVVVEKAIAEKFLSKLIGEVKKTPVGSGLDEEWVMGPMVDAGPVQEALHYIDSARKEGGEIAVGGHRPKDEACARGHFLEPTVITGVKPSMTVAQEEIFGPVLSVLVVKDFDAAIEVANGVRYGLSSAVYTRNVERVFEYQNRIEAGLLHVNCPTIFSEVHLPFGGMKDTGGTGGREMGKTAMEFFTEWQTMYLNYRSK